MNKQMKKFNSNTWRILFATWLSALCLIAPSTQAATITVTNTNDSGAGSLRQALADAVDGDTINFDSSLNGQTIMLTSGQLVVDKSVVINGPGAANLAVNGNAADRVFYVSEHLIVTISDLTIENGNVLGLGGYGGGIFNAHSTLTVSNCTITGNWALHGGGGIFNYGDWDSAALTVTNCTISGNATWYYYDGAGGGISSSAFFGTAPVEVEILNSTISDNWAAMNGGGIFNGGVAGRTRLTVTNCTISGNSALYGGYGGGLYNDGAFWDFSTSSSATMTINNSTVSGNYALAEGGGIYNDGFAGNATLTISNSTLSSNSAFFAGGLRNDGSFGSATLIILNSTLSDNSSNYSGGISNYGPSGSAMLEIGNTILKTGASGETMSNLDGTISSDGYNVSSDDGGGFLTGTGDQINTDPLLGPLQDNGGPTFTHALLRDSPAIDAGDPNFTPPPDYDQRGADFTRVFNGRVDIGAFEVQTVAPAYAGQVQPPINPDGSSTFNVRHGVVPVKFNLTLGGVATCDLPSATIAVTRIAGGVIGEINESVYSGNADTGANFRIDSCQYIYNLNSRALGAGTYRVDILIDGQVVGNAVFGLN